MKAPYPALRRSEMRFSFPLWRRATGASLAVVALGLLASGGTSPAVKAVEPAEDGVVAATIKDQTELAVTVYNSNIALVRDVRQVALPSGILDLRFLDIAATVNPATVHFRSLSEPSRLGILEQNYQFDLLDPQRLLKKYIGRDVTLVRTRMDNGTSRQEEVTRAAAGLQRRAGLEDRQRDRHRHARRPVPLPRDPREPAQPADAGLEGRQQRPAPASDRDVVPGDEHVVDGRLRPHRRARRRQGRPRRMGDSDQHERDVLQQREAAAGRRRPERVQNGRRSTTG